MFKRALQFGLMSGLVFSSCVAKPKAPETELQSPANKAEKTEPTIESAAKMKSKCCKPSTEKLDSLLVTVQSARKSADQAKMIAALAATENHIAEMKEHKKKCQGMMEEMMGGDGMMGKHGMKSAPADTAASPSAKEPSKTESSGHEKHH